MRRLVPRARDKAELRSMAGGRGGEEGWRGGRRAAEGVVSRVCLSWRHLCVCAVVCEVGAVVVRARRPLLGSSGARLEGALH